MKKTVVLLLTFLLFFSCSPQKNSENFIKEFSGRYLFNANEVIEIYFKNNELFIKWRGDENIRPLKVNDSTFYMKELNEKIIFISKPNVHIELAEKVEHKGEKYFFKKLKQNEKTPLELVESGEFEKALQAYLKIKKQDSLNLSISRSTINKLGYSFLRKNQNKKAIEIFKINTQLYTNNSNTYNSLAEAFLKNKDTLKAIENYKKSTSINPENRNSTRMLKILNK